MSGKEPEFFIKTSDSVVGPGESIRYDEMLTRKLDCETELAIVIGKAGRHIPVARAIEQPGGGGRGPRQPVQHDVIQHLVQGQGVLGVSLIVGPTTPDAPLASVNDSPAAPKTGTALLLRFRLEVCFVGDIWNSPGLTVLPHLHAADDCLRSPGRQRSPFPEHHLGLVSAFRENAAFVLPILGAFPPEALDSRLPPAPPSPQIP
jgi:Fumarylacetoacetate (FAA) hydrolase family